MFVRAAASSTTTSTRGDPASPPAGRWPLRTHAGAVLSASAFASFRSPGPWPPIRLLQPAALSLRCSAPCAPARASRAPSCPHGTCGTLAQLGQLPSCPAAHVPTLAVAHALHTAPATGMMRRSGADPISHGAARLWRAGAGEGRAHERGARGVRVPQVPCV